MKKATKITSNPIAVVLSDVHFNLHTKDIANAALNAGIDEAIELKIPLFIDGDLNDTKAILRGECVNLLIKAFKRAEKAKIGVYINIGNHDLLNEKGQAHSLEFLKPYAYLIEEPTYIEQLRAWVIPYQNDIEKFTEILKTIPLGSNIAMHQGVRGAHMGDYVIDKTSIDPNLLKEYKVISGHYHRYQTVGTVTFIGNPYTVSFGEANDGPKGYQILKEDFTLDQVVLPLRKHIIVERNVDQVFESIPNLRSEDKLWLKVSGPSIELDKLDKKKIGQVHLGHQNFKLDRISTDSIATKFDTTKHTAEQLLDKIVDESIETHEQKKYLKNLWREVMG